MVADHRQEVIRGDLGDALLGQERPQVKAFQGEGHVAVDFEGVHHLVAKAFQMDTQDLGRGEICGLGTWPSSHPVARSSTEYIGTF